MKLDNINLDIETAEIMIGGEKIHIKSYLPTAGKMDLVDALKMEVLNEPIINQPKLDALLNIFIVINYTDIEIENRDIDNLLRVYDYLEYNGIIDVILQKIPKVELDALIGYVKDTVEDFNRYKVSGAGTMESLVANLPTLMESINVLKEELKDEDLEVARTLYNKLEH